MYTIIFNTWQMTIYCGNEICQKPAGQDNTGDCITRSGIIYVAPDCSGSLLPIRHRGSCVTGILKSANKSGQGYFNGLHYLNRLPKFM